MERGAAGLDRRGAAPAAALAALLLVVAFDAGGSFPDTTAFVACALLAALAVRIVTADAPLAGWGRGVASAALPLLALAGWSMLSAVWSHATIRAADAAARTLAYALVLLLAASPAAADGAGRLRWAARGVAFAAAAVGTAALATDLAPALFPTDAGVLEDRLAFPLTYWNALGLLAGSGIVLLAALSSDGDEPLLGRAAAAAALPALACTLYLTFSRGAIAVTLAGVAVLIALGPRRGLVATALAAAAPVAAAVLAAAASDALARPGRVGDGAVAAVVAACMALAAAARGLVARRLEARLWLPRLRPAPLLAAAALVAAIGAVAIVRTGDVPGGTADLRARLTSTSSSDRGNYWRVALSQAGDEPLAGSGAGTYELDWQRARPRPARVQYAHSAYLETLAELGVTGLVLLALAIAAMLWALARRARTSVPALALLAAAVAWTLHVAVDWDWQVPAVTLWLPAAAGVALAGAGAGRAAGWRPSLPVRALVGAVLIAAALGAWQLAVSERRLEQALTDYESGDCAAALDAAQAGLVRRPQADVVAGLCGARAGDPDAITPIRAAIAADPESFEPYLALAEIRAARGEDPGAALRQARLRDPLEPAVLAAMAPGADVAAVPLVIDGIDRPALGRVRSPAR